jgi:hypothetical protein
MSEATYQSLVRGMGDVFVSMEDTLHSLEGCSGRRSGILEAEGTHGETEEDTGEHTGAAPAEEGAVRSQTPTWRGLQFSLRARRSCRASSSHMKSTERSPRTPDLMDLA